MRIAVVGGGFSGLVFAYKLASKGYDVDVYEEHGGVGFPPHCTGLVSMDTVGLIGGPAWENILGTYRGVVLDVEGYRCTINTVNKVVKLDRVRLEESLLEAALMHGARVFLGRRVTSVSRDGRVSIGGVEKWYDMIVLAEGLSGSLRRRLGVEHKVTTTVGLNIEHSSGVESVDRDHVWIRFARGLDGFSWKLVFLERLLAGALSLNPGQVKRWLNRFTRALGDGFLYGGVVVHGPPLRNPRVGRVLIVGDAAGFNKPLTGGGLYPNAFLAEAVAGSDLSSGSFAGVDRVVSRLVGKLYRQYRIARGYYRDPGRGVLLLKSLVQGGLCDVLNGRIDYDGHERLISLLLAYPFSGLRAVFSGLRGTPRGFLEFVLDFIGFK